MNRLPVSLRARGMSQTTASLLERLRSRDQAEAWGHFVDLYTPLLYFWACRMGLRAPDAAEVVKDVFESIAEALPSFSPDTGKNFRNWLRDITLQRWDANRRQHAEALRHTETVAVAEVAAPDDAEAMWDTEYRQYLVGRALEMMRSEFPPTAWKACWSFTVEGKPAEQVAVELGLTVEAVFAARARVLRRLRHELDGLLD
jgi:RNA polymerase sigma-70 factor (ECF subfamily)